jgi:mannosylglucosylglycerate synthase
MTISPSIPPIERTHHDLESKKILIIHFRVGKTDGVSLEIEKRKLLLQEMGHEVDLLAGNRHYGADFVIPDLEFDTDEFITLRKNCIRRFEDYRDVDALKAHLYAAEERIFRDFDRIFAREEFDLVFVHNVFSLAIHIPATMALFNIIKHYRLPCVSVNHDFYWEGDITTRPQFPFIEDILNQYYIPTLPYIRHVTINTLNVDRLKSMGIDCFVNFDVLDFEQQPWGRDEFNQDFRQRFQIAEHDLVILQATRLVPNKAIECAMDFVKMLQDRRQALVGKQLYNQQRFTETSRIILLLAGYAEDDRLAYQDQLKRYAETLQIETIFAGEHFDLQRREEQGKKTYSLWDAYVYADLVTYPSIWEGWGNQFIEAVFARKPLVVFEYPVFLQDIQPEGYTYISLGNTYEQKPDGLIQFPPVTLTRAVEKTQDLLLDPVAYQTMIAHNFTLGQKNHSHQVLRSYLRECLDWAQSV